MRKISKVLFGLAATSLLGLSACGKENNDYGDPKAPEMDCFTYMTYTAISPSNWNPLTYQDSNDTQIMSYIGGNFFTFNYEFDEKGNVVEGGFATEYDGATKLEDVTGSFVDDSLVGGPAAEFENDIPLFQDRDGDGNPDYTLDGLTTDGDGYAYKITLRDDLKWDDGTPIHAADFVRSMKDQLDPAFLNYRADSFYNSSVVIHNAQNYVKQGQEGLFAASDVYELSDYGTNVTKDQLYFYGVPALEEGDEGYNADFDGKLVGKSHVVSYFSQNSTLATYFEHGGVLAILWAYGGYTPVDDKGEEITIASVEDLENYIYPVSKSLHGKTITEIEADATLKALWEDVCLAFWQTDPGEEIDFCVTPYTYPELDFSKVGIFVGDNENELILVLDKSIQLLEDDGSLNYQAAYYLSDLPLVHEAKFNANKVEPKIDGGLWTSTYNSSVESTASWGPYKLTYFQAGKQYILERNENWYGYNMDEYKGQYQTDRIVCNTIAEWNTAWLSFQQGNVTTIGIDISIASDYKSSARAVYSGDDYVGSMQLQSSATGLKGRETDGVDKEMLLYPDFRKALSLAVDRADLTKKCTTASLPGFGIFNAYHYYDVAHGGVYRDEDVAKVVICETYGVNIDDYNSLDEAYAAVTGYNLELARQLLDSAYDEALAAGTINATDKVVLTFGTSTDNENTRRYFNYLKNAYEELAKGTKLEGRLTLDFDASFGTKWANDFRDGAYDICLGGWSGAAWDPGYFLLAYLSPDYMYSQAWDTASETLTYNPWQDGDPTHELTMSLMDWYYCLNGNSKAPNGTDWSEGKAPVEFRLGIIAQLEKAVLQKYYTVPFYYWYSATLVSYKVEYFSTTYNTFMGFGGIRYMRYRYDDLAWSYIKGTFNYKG